MNACFVLIFYVCYMHETKNSANCLIKQFSLKELLAM